MKKYGTRKKLDLDEREGDEGVRGSLDLLM